jgi:hypothetical protein
MSDAFKNLDYGNQAQNLIQETQDRSTKLAALDKTRTTRGTIEENVGFLKSALSGKELLEGTYKGLKPYVKQQLAKSADKEANDSLQEATDARDALQAQHSANATARTAEEASDTQDIQDATSVAKAGGATDATVSSDAGVQSAVASSFSKAVVRQGAEQAESGAMNDANAAVAKAGQAVAKRVAVKAGEDAGEETGEAVGEISGGEALGAVLDATGIGAPIGLLIGALGIGLGIRTGSAKRAPKLAPQSLNQSGRAYQVGIN